MDKIETLLPYVKLKFNIEYPMLDECYQFGYECAEAKIEEEQNPFEPGTAEYDYWTDGWWDAFYGAEQHLTPALVAGVNIQDAAANDSIFGTAKNKIFLKRFFKITMVLAASALLSYQVLDLVA